MFVVLLVTEILQSIQLHYAKGQAKGKQCTSEVMDTMVHASSALYVRNYFDKVNTKETPPKGL